jgi:hypothetical protein
LLFLTRHENGALCNASTMAKKTIKVSELNNTVCCPRDGAVQKTAFYFLLPDDS